MDGDDRVEPQMTDFRAEMSQLTSRKGWALASYDKRIWVPCPLGLPEGWDHARWAREFAAAWWGLSGLAYGDTELEKLTTLLDYIYESTWGPGATIPCHLAFIHLPDPRMLPLPVYLAILRSLNPKGEELRRLTRADDPAVIEPPIIEDFTTEHLGQGLRVLRYWHGDDEGEVAAGLGYAWRSEQYETDLRLFTASSDLARLQQAIPDIDELARQITVVPREMWPR
jgi:hypothetical protein